MTKHVDPASPDALQEYSAAARILVLGFLAPAVLAFLVGCGRKSLDDLDEELDEQSLLTDPLLAAAYEDVDDRPDDQAVEAYSSAQLPKHL